MAGFMRPEASGRQVESRASPVSVGLVRLSSDRHDNGQVY